MVFLSEDTSFTVEDSSGSRVPVRKVDIGSGMWRTISISVIPRLALVIPLNSRVVFESVQVTAGNAGFITFGPTGQDRVPGGLRVVVRFRRADGASSAERTSGGTELFSEDMPAFDPRQPWVERQFGLDTVIGATGSFTVECTAGSDVPGKDGECGCYEFVISDTRLLDLNRARAFRQLRIRNERASCDAYYQHAIFQPNDPNAPVQPDSEHTIIQTTPPDSIGRKGAVLLQRLYRRLIGERGITTVSADHAQGWHDASSHEPLPPHRENAFSYSRHLLLARMDLQPPSFGWRLRTTLKTFNSGGHVGRSSRFRILSLCSGAARIEADLLRGLPADRLKITLVDVNPNLLNVATQRLSEWCEVEAVVTDVNELDLQGERFDVIMCVSGLHHVVELEHLIGTVARGLQDTGEFWSIGENIGRNGGRLWPDSYEVANGFFVALDDKYRINRMTGLNVDEYLPDMDYSVGCFEGIRCEAIEPTLLNFLAPVEVCKHNCVIWKLFSPTYSDNYHMDCPEDVALVEAAVDLEVDFVRRGGRPIELNGIYTRRQ